MHFFKLSPRAAVQERERELRLENSHSLLEFTRNALRTYGARQQESTAEETVLEDLSFRGSAREGRIADDFGDLHSRGAPRKSD